MGNSSSQTSKILSEESWNLSKLPELKKSLGFRTAHLYSSFPKSIPEEKVFSNLDLRNFSCPDGNKLSEFLEEILTHLQGEFVKENWSDNAFPSTLESISLLDGELNTVNLTDEELNTIRQQFKLPQKVKVTKKVKDENDEEKEIEEENELDVEQVYEGYSIYQFGEDGLGMPLEMKKVGIESCFVGSMDDKLVVMAPSEEPVLSRCIRFNWQVVQVGKDSLRLILNDARGVVFENGKELEEVSENYFENLDKAYQSFENNNSREMSLYGNRYLTWVNQVRENGELQALAGGEIDGDMISLAEFVDKMKL